jgi:hypothetical protein
MRNTEKFTALSGLLRKKGLPEPIVTMSNFERGRNYVLGFPALKDFGFNTNDYTHWTKVYSRMSKSKFYGQFIGWEEKLPDGKFARYRFDFDPELRDQKTGALIKEGLGAHFNIEIKVPKGHFASETYKLAVKVLCNGKTCTEAEALSYLKALNR